MLLLLRRNWSAAHSQSLQLPMPALLPLPGKVEEELGAGGRWRIRSWSTGPGEHHSSAPGSFCCSFASLPFRTSILLLCSLCQNIHRWEGKQFLFVNGKLGAQLGKIVLQHYTISKSSNHQVFEFNYTVKTNLMYHLSIYLIFSQIVLIRNYWTSNLQVKSAALLTILK